jgi:hypothetical protein
LKRVLEIARIGKEGPLPRKADFIGREVFFKDLWKGFAPVGKRTPLPLLERLQTCGRVRLGKPRRYLVNKYSGPFLRTQKYDERRQGATPDELDIKGCRRLLGSGSRCGKSTNDNRVYCEEHI